MRRKRTRIRIYIYIFQCQGIRRFTNCARLCLYRDKDYSSDPCLVEKVVRLSGKRIISSWRGFKADSNGRSIMLIKEREKVVEVDNVWVMNRGSPVRVQHHRLSRILYDQPVGWRNIYARTHACESGGWTCHPHRGTR